MLKYLFIFSIFSLIGWILEFCFRSIRNNKFINPGFMSGCVVPLYGFGTITIVLLCNLIDSYNIHYAYKLSLIFLSSMIFLSLLEFITGLVVLKLFKIRLWNYSNSKFNYKGFVRLEFSITWGLLALLFYKYIYSWIISIISVMSINLTLIFILGIYYGIFIIDLCITLNVIFKRLI